MGKGGRRSSYWIR